MSEALKDFLYIVLLICIPYMSVFVKKGMGAVVDAAVAYIRDVRIQRIVREIGTAVSDAVGAMNQKYVTDLKKDGKFDEEHQAEILQKAVCAALKSLSDDAQKYLETNYGDTTAYLENKIESQIDKNKTSAAG